jgi:hypothetical protein
VREDGYHAVIECPHAKALREAMRKVWQLPGENWLRNTGPEWLLVPLDTGTVDEVANLELILWRVWLDRNKVTQAGEFLMQLDTNMKLAGVRDAEGKGGGNMAEK